MLLADFRIQFPEFKGVSDGLVQVMLNASLLELDSTVWGQLLDQGQAYLAAHKLATSPFGQNAKMVAKDGTTTYWFNYFKLVRKVTSGYRVA
jgi:hypothetical protein